MSAFMCSPAHFSALVNFAANASRYGGMEYRYKGMRLAVKGREAQVYGMLAKANADSVNHRYAHNDDAQQNTLDGYEFRPSRVTLPAVTIIKACHCLAYQSCELDDWEDSEAFAFLQALISHASHNLPGYDDAPWGL